MSKFNHGLSDDFTEQLAEEAKKGSWWTDILNDSKLFVAVRDNYLNVYWRGHSLFRVTPGPNATTHVKYLHDPDIHDQVQLVAGKFKIRELRDRGFVTHYEGPKTLNKMRRASDLFSGLEKTGCHEIILANPQVVDCEIAFGSEASPRDGAEKGMPRVDLATLEPGNGEGARLVFWEAKDYCNSDLRAEDGRSVPVCDQVKKYQKYLSVPENREAVVESYRRVAKNLVAIGKMGLRRHLPPLIREVAAGKRSLTLDAEPKVGLVIFGFDRAEKVHPGWKRDLGRLKHEVAPVVAAGGARNVRLKL